MKRAPPAREGHSPAHWQVKVKFVIPGSPGNRPARGGGLEVDDAVLSVNGQKVDASTVVDLVRGVKGKNQVGTQVALRVKRAATGAEETVLCLRAPLNFVQRECRVQISRLGTMFCSSLMTL